MRTLIFIPAYDEEENLPSVLEEVRRELPEADVLVVDDGSSDGTAEAGRAGGAEVLSFGENRGLREAVAAGFAYALEHGYELCGRVDADGQHPPAELRRLLELVRTGECDVAVGSRFVAGEGYTEYRYRPTPARAFGTALLRRLTGFGDATSGLYAVNAPALAILAEPYTSGAPEVEAVMRIRSAGLRLREVPVDMRERQAGESKLRGATAVKLVATVGLALLVARRLRR